jgi:hypothetical protein
MHASKADLRESLLVYLIRALSSTEIPHPRARNWLLVPQGNTTHFLLPPGQRLTGQHADITCTARKWKAP